MISRRRLLSLPAVAAAPAMAKESEPLDLPEDLDPDKDTPKPQLLRLSANRKYYKALLSIRADYRTRLAEMIGFANHVTIHLLDFEIGAQPDEEKEDQHYFIRPYQRYTNILQTRELAEKERAACLSHLQRLLRTRGDEGWSAFCHYPIHAVRVRLDDDFLFSTSFCWECTNYFVPYPDDAESSATWVGLKDPALQEFINQQLPVPASEIERFQRAIKKKPE